MSSLRAMKKTIANKMKVKKITKYISSFSKFSIIRFKIIKIFIADRTYKKFHNELEV